VHVDWQTFWDGLRADFVGQPDWFTFGRFTLRLSIAGLLGGILGFERETKHKEAGLRTHILVALGAALIMAVAQQSPGPDAAISRALQGVTVGIGFLGAGAIIKDRNQESIRGLTTAGGIWFTAAIGMAAGLGQIGYAVFGAALAIIVLALLLPLENWMHRRK
jgi:putative Mg2+ transporter-C (MgtC) family protein